MGVEYRQFKGWETSFSDMLAYELDGVDKQLLNLLQENARYKMIEMADEIGVSDNTIHNRMEQLEEPNIITGYATTTDYD